MPSSPGVYWYLNASGDVLYVGKAKNIKKRLHQYAYEQDDRHQIKNLMLQTKAVKWSVQESELEALLVEAELIKKYQPQFNILLKDDKSALYICLSNAVFPRVYTARKPEIVREEKKPSTFGPFQSGFQVKQVLHIARTVFKWCDHPPLQSIESLPVKPRPCFYHHIELCSGACVGKVREHEYHDMIANLKAFLRGKTSEVVKNLKAEIEESVVRQQFEKAAQYRDQLEALLRVTSPKYRLAPQVTLPVLTQNREQEALISLRSLLRQYLSVPPTFHLKRIEGYDISNIQGTNASSSMVVAIDGRMTSKEYKHFGIKTIDTPNDYAMMKETLLRRQQHPEWGIPDLVLIDGGKGQLRSALSVWNWPSIVVSLAKRPDRLIIPILSLATTKKQPVQKLLTMYGMHSEEEKMRKETKTTISYKEILLTPEITATFLLQSIRDESHRFAKRLHTIKRNTDMIVK